MVTSCEELNGDVMRRVNWRLTSFHCLPTDMLPTDFSDHFGSFFKTTSLGIGLFFLYLQRVLQCRQRHFFNSPKIPSKKSNYPTCFFVSSSSTALPKEKGPRVTVAKPPTCDIYSRFTPPPKKNQRVLNDL